MTETYADPLASGPATTTTADPVAAPPAPAAVAEPEPLVEADPRDEVIAQLQQAVAALQSASGAPVTVTAAAAGSALAAPAATGGPPAHAMSTDISGAEPGDIVRYVTTGIGGEKVGGYGLIVEVLDIDDATGGTPVSGQPSHAAVVVGRLEIVGAQLTAADIVDIEASSAIHAQNGG